MAQTIIFVPVTTPDADPSGILISENGVITSMTGVAQNFVRTCRLMGLNDAQTIQQLGQDWTNGAYVSFVEG